MQNAARYTGGVFVFGVYALLSAKPEHCSTSLLLD
jgi:hypothetical protein